MSWAFERGKKLEYENFQLFFEMSQFNMHSCILSLMKRRYLTRLQARLHGFKKCRG
jgi:hypothetical protein